MARSVAAEAQVALEPGEALALWTNTDRWPTFVEGFARVLEQSEGWPEAGSKVVWESNPAGRGRVTEKVLDHGPGSLRSQVFEERLVGEQTVRFGDGLMTLRLDYDLAGGGPFAALTDVLFIRRALRDSLRRTVARFAVEAEDEAGLR